MRAWWLRWVAFTGEPAPSAPLVWVRRALALALLGDLVSMALRGAAPPILYPARLGGIADHGGAWFLLGAFDEAGRALAVTLTLALPLVIVGGRFTRPALVVTLISASQLGHMFRPGDRGIDRLIRTAFLVLVCSPVGGDRVPATVARWTEDLLRWILAIVYLSAGIAKVSSSMDWIVPSATPPVYRIMAAPLHGTLDPVWWYDHTWLFVLAGWATLAVELTAPLVLSRRWGKWWAIPAACIHLGIAAGMKLGMFSWGMLAFYPMLLWPWLGVRSAKRTN